MCDAIEAYMAGESPMSDEDFQRLVLCQVMTDKIYASKDENQRDDDATGKVVATAFETFNQVMT